MQQIRASIAHNRALDESQIFGMKPEFPQTEVLRHMSGPNGRRSSRKTLNKIAAWSSHLENIVRPRLIYSTRRIADCGRSNVTLPNGIVLKGTKLARAHRNCSSIVFFTATLGPAIDLEIRRLTQNNCLSDAFIIDTMGSVAVEQLVERFYQLMRSYFINQGKGVTLRFSPGYCDWPLQEQRKVFRLVKGDLIGVQLTDSCLMTPQKSVSGIFGITKDVESGQKPYNPCSICGKLDCSARRGT